jgi:hypothetical protein
MNKGKWITWIVIVGLNLAFVGALALLLLNSGNTASPPSVLAQTVVSTPTAQPTPTPSPEFLPTPEPSQTFQTRTEFKYDRYSDPVFNFTTVFPRGWSILTTRVSDSELQAKFRGLINDNPESGGEVYVGYYQGGLYTDWFNTIGSLTYIYRLENIDIKNGSLPYSTFIKNVQAKFCRAYVSEVIGGVVVLECSYVATALTPPEEQLLDSTVKVILASINNPNSSELISAQPASTP